MLSFLIKIVISSLVISFASWLSNKKPQLAGFIIALPLTTIIALFFSYIEHGDKSKSVAFAKSIFIGIPATLTFFIPFIFNKFLGLNFWASFILGIIFLIIGFIIHKNIMNYL